MTNEEMFNQNIKIAYKLVQQYKDCGIEIEDLKQICLLALWKATQTFKSDKGYTFSTYSYRVIQNEVNYYLRQNRKYFTNRYFSEKVIDNITLEDILADERDLIEELENNIDNENIFNLIKNAALKNDEKIVIELSLKGYRQQKIAEIIGCSQPQVSRYIKGIRKKLEENEEKKCKKN